ncbi:MAG: phenylalanine--tRNA ligase subunit alpha [Deltaproteobacteria bacterium]
MNLEGLLKNAFAELSTAASLDAVSGIRAKYLGRKGSLTLFFKELSGLAPDDRKAAGEALNNAKNAIESEIYSLEATLKERGKEEALKKQTLDATLPGRLVRPGRTHPITQVVDEIEDIFLRLGFEIAEGPEVELDYYNFEALNFPKDHPARDMQDTFFISDELLLRTHTSPVQIRVMEQRRPPLRVIAPGTVYRRDSDITHSPMFHQIEGFMVDRAIGLSDLKGVLTHFLKLFFGANTAVRLRPSFFPFTEPSAEVDIRCVMCKGLGCRVCKGSGWLEILGAGLIHPEVLKAVKYDPELHSGFAFGLGIERVAMLKFGIDDLRLFFDNDLRFLRQF